MKATRISGGSAEPPAFRGDAGAGRLPLLGVIPARLRRAARLASAGHADLLLQRACAALRLPPFPTRFPSVLVIEPTNRCNLRCPLCPTGSGRLPREARDMTLAEFRSIVEQARGRSLLVQLFFCGEPFLNDDLFAMIRCAAQLGIAVETSTNGMLLSSERVREEIVASGLRHLILSLDGADQETLQAYRAGARFETIAAGVRALVETRDRVAARAGGGRSSRVPTIELQMIVMKQNEHQRSAMLALARDWGVDWFTEKTLSLMGSPLDDPQANATARGLLPKEPDASRFRVAADGRLAAKERPGHCRLIHQTAVILSNGTVVPCCYDGEGNHPLGNVFESRLEDIWNGEGLRAFRSLVHAHRDRVPMCTGCPEGRRPLVLRRTRL